MAGDQYPNICLLLNSASILLARGTVQSPPDAPNIQLQITDGDPDAVVQAGLVQAIPVNAQHRAKLGQVILRRGNKIVLGPIRDLNEAARQNLRVPVSFETFLYPVRGGRARAKAHDLSCGGIAFYTSCHLELRERFEIVIPITTEPLLARAECLREGPCPDAGHFYAAQFPDLCHDEEAMIREAVFSVQLEQKASLQGSHQK